MVCAGTNEVILLKKKCTGWGGGMAELIADLKVLDIANVLKKTFVSGGT
jgi:hypothetical protein